jgi:hypothetical protein
VTAIIGSVREAFFALAGTALGVLSERAFFEQISPAAATD